MRKQINRSKLGCAPASLAFALLCCPIAALAQPVQGAPEAEEDASVTNAEIIVTARKREERAIDVPIALSTFGGDELERRGADTLADFLQEAPGVGAYDSGGGSSKITIRGISTSLGGNENGYYLNDLPFTGVTVPLSPDVRAWDIERVEVLRGPQGTLFGEGSMGGTVRILTRNADLDRWEAKGLGFASDTHDGGFNGGVKGAFNAPIVPGVLAVRVSGTHERFDGWIDNPATGEKNVNDQEYGTFRAAARFRPASRLTIDANYWRYRGDFAEGSREGDDGNVPLAFGGGSLSNYDLYGVTGRYDLGGAELFYGFALNDFFQSATTEAFGGEVIQSLKIHVESHEARINSTGDGPLQWTFGGYLRNARRSDDIVFALFGIDNVDRTDSEARALFGEVTYDLGRFDLTAGLRYYEEDLGGFEDNSGVIVEDEGRSYRSWNPRFSIGWHPVENMTVYASAAKGFRSGQLQPTFSLVLAETLGIDLPVALDQDTIWTYELGAKAELLDRKLSIEGAIFHSDWKDVAVRVPLGNFSGLINSKGTKTTGVELALSARPAPALTLSASGAYIDATYAEDVPNTGILKGVPVDAVAKFIANASMQYSFDLSSDVGGFFRIGWQHNSPRESRSLQNTAPGDTIDQVDARVGVDFGSLSIALFTENLFNDRGAVSNRSTNQVAPGVFDSAATRLRPRTIGIQASFNFGGPVR